MKSCYPGRILILNNYPENPLPLLFLSFLLVPLAEIWLLIKVGSIIGAGWTILAVVGTAVAGAALVRAQGLSTISKIQDAMHRGEAPAMEMLEGMALFITGALMLTPGFFTDALGFMLLIPPVRRQLIIYMLKRSGVMVSGYAAHRPEQASRDRKPLEGEWRRTDDD